MSDDNAKMTTLVYKMLNADAAGEKRRAAEVIAALGIKFEDWHPAPMADLILLHGCSNIPDELPSYIVRAENPKWRRNQL